MVEEDVLIKQPAMKKGPGGKREGAGRPKGTGKYGEPTQAIRVPKSVVPQISDWLKERTEIQKEQKISKSTSLELLKSIVGKSSDLNIYSNKVAAGFPSPADDHIEDTLDLNQHLIKNPTSTFYLRVSGDSMIGAGIHEDDLLVVDRSLEPVDGKIVIAAVNGELTVKRLQTSKGACVSLMPENNNFEPIEITQESDFRIWGVVTNVIHQV